MLICFWFAGSEPFETLLVSVQIVPLQFVEVVVTVVSATALDDVRRQPISRVHKGTSLSFSRPDRKACE
jgi:hypothetical protein